MKYLKNKQFNFYLDIRSYSKKVLYEHFLTKKKIKIDKRIACKLLIIATLDRTLNYYHFQSI